ncbi:CheR family methyltransferase [Gemmatirosa kalamazoonensis]|uniref:CheR family methyltransferase n=1 Tax=Gemmatirosa kalamazoonensis TaxID=861299 RepID=UPI00046D72EB|nr:protein-glutamate O-methyltransferase CheR [Gemmatirosa kalamazoonensis]
MTAPLDADDPEGLARLLVKVTVERGFRCGSYKERCLRRRIAVRMRAKGVHTFDDYARVLDADAHEYDRLLDALTINVTKLFRNWDSWSALAAKALPKLWDVTGGAMRVWSAGTSSGEEAYSLAALLHRHAESRGETARLDGALVLGTDIDRASLAAAARGTFGDAAFADTPAELRERYFPGALPAAAAPELRSLVAFEHRDLLLEPPPAGPWHLIVCRNVLIYFDRQTQEVLFERFHEALAPGGMLFLGKVETLLGPARQRFAAVDQRERIYRRL